MTTGGWVFMLVSWLVIILVLAFCYCRSLSSPENEETPYPNAEDLD